MLGNIGTKGIDKDQVISEGVEVKKRKVSKKKWRSTEKKHTRHREQDYKCN